jgi:hypothetical protein
VSHPCIHLNVKCLHYSSFDLNNKQTIEKAYNMKPAKNNRPAASHWKTLSHNVVSSTLGLGGIRTHNVNGVRHELHR